MRRIGALALAALLFGAGPPAHATETNGATAWTGTQGGNSATVNEPSGLTVTVTTTSVATRGLVTVGDTTTPTPVSQPLNSRAATAAMFGTQDSSDADTLLDSPSTLAVGTTQAVNFVTQALASCPVAPASSTATCTNMGTITVAFSRPVRNPVLHLSGLGATNDSGGLFGSDIARLNARLTLAGSSPAGATLGVRSAGAVNMVASGNTIETANVNASTSCGTLNDAAPENAAALSGCGSVQVNGTVTSLTFNVEMKYQVVDCTGLLCVPSSISVDGAADAYNLTVSLPQDFSDAPASFGVPRHVIGDLRIGGVIDADRTNTENPAASSFAATSPSDAIGDDTEASVADDNEPGDDEEGVAFGGGLSTALIGSTYTATVALSGVSQAGEACGWIDFNRGGAFETTERACTTFAAGATSAILGWTVPATTTTGLAYARVRAAYGAAGGLASSPTGAVASGEVEDHQLDIMQPSFGTCDARMWLTQSPGAPTPTTLYQIDTGTNPFTFAAQGTAAVLYNAVGYNTADNYLYGLITTNTNTLVRIGADGTAVNLGAVAGLPVATYISGAFGTAGDILYVKNNAAAGTVMYAVNVATLTATPVTLSAAINIADWAWVGGLLYGVTNGGQLVSVNPATGAVTSIGAPNGLPAGFFGAMYGAPNGLYGSGNDPPSGFYQFDLATGAATLISGSPGSNANDGANCASANIAFGADLALTKTNTPGVNGEVDQATDTYTPGTNVVYTITIGNSGPFGAQNATVSDPLPAGIATASWTCTGTAGGACTASGTGAINDATVDLPVGGSVTYLLTLAVPPDFSGSLVNTATVTAGAGTSESNTANNSATDSDTQNSVANLSISKASTPEGPFMPGQTVSYAIVVGNAGPSSADGATVHDPAAAGLNCTAITSCTPTGGAACPGSLTVSGLQTSPGLAIPTLPSGGSVTFVLSCQVTATGQ